MWYKLIIIVIFLSLTGCKEHLPALKEDSLYKIYDAKSTDYCIEDVINHNSCPGYLYLKKNGKVLFYINCSKKDTSVYYRGTYFVSDSGLQCTFNSVYTKAASCTNCPDQKRQPSKKYKKFRDEVTWHLQLKRTGCGPADFYGTASRAPVEFTKPMVYKRGTNRENIEFCGFISGVDALIDFHCRQEAIDQKNTDETEAENVKNYVDEIEDYYSRKFETSTITKSKNDSVTYLTIVKKSDADEYESESTLFIQINKTGRQILSGDLDNDGTKDSLVVVTVNESGGTSWQDLFVFTFPSNKRRLTAVSSNVDLAACTEGSYGGIFKATEIKNGLINGTSVCYTDDDADCCPSVKVKTSVVLNKNQLKPAKTGAEFE